MKSTNCKYMDYNPKGWAHVCTLPVKSHELCQAHLDKEIKRLEDKVQELNKNLYFVRQQLTKLTAP